MDPGPGSSSVPTVRALVIGTAGSAAIGVGVFYTSTRLATFFTTGAAVVLFFVLVFFLNTLVGLIRRAWMLRRAELALIYIMWIVATAIPERGLTSILLPHITAVIYFATPENNWGDLFPYIPDWMIPHHDIEQIKNFYEGAPQGEGIPWSLWLPPLLHWMPFVLALYLAMIAMMVIVRKQWIVHERLVYPMVQVPVAMVQEDERGPSLMAPLFKNWLMWLGFTITAVIYLTNRLHGELSYVPMIKYWGAPIYLFRESVRLDVGLSFWVLGFSYFISREVAFSLCFFHLLGLLQQVCYNMLGIQRVDTLFGAYSRQDADSMLSLQGFGAFVALVLFGLWTARGHLRQVLRKAFRGDPDVDDCDEILSYRAAVFLMLGSLLVMCVWMWRSGLPGWIAPMYVFFAFIVFVAITRVLAEGGLAWKYAPVTASDFVAAGVGTRALGPSGITSLAFTYIWASDILIFVMASCANGLKLAEEAIKTRRRLVFWAILIAILVSLIGSIWALMDLCYRYGGLNVGGFFFNYGARLPFDDAIRRLHAPVGDPHWENWGFTTIGAVVMGLLMVARQRFLWWPFHPLGFPLSPVFGSAFFSVFLGWLLKSVALKYGGVRLYLRTRPFFIGLLLGWFAATGLWPVLSRLVWGGF